MANRPQNNVYVSSNTREGTQMPDAYRMVASPAHAALTQATPGGRSGYGVWKDGAEDARVFSPADPSSLAQVADSLRKQFAQKSVATFTETPQGPDALHVITIRETDPEKAHRDSLSYGIEHKTILPDPEGLTLHIIDPGKQLERAVAAYAAAHGAHPETHTGIVDFRERE